MDLNKIDPNFSPKKFNPDDFEWHEITEEEYKAKKAVYVETILELYVKGIIDKEQMQEKLNQ